MCLQNLFRDRMAEVHGPTGILAQGRLYHPSTMDSVVRMRTIRQPRAILNVEWHEEVPMALSVIFQSFQDT
jgi:hypothetical protein